MPMYSVAELEENGHKRLSTPEMEFEASDYLAGPDPDFPDAGASEKETEDGERGSEPSDKGYNALVAYFKAVGGFGLLTRAEEVRLAKAMETGRKTRWHMLAGLPPVMKRVLAVHDELLANPSHFKAVLDPSLYRTRPMAKTAYRRLLKSLEQVRQLYTGPRNRRRVKTSPSGTDLPRAIGTILVRIPWSGNQISEFMTMMQDLKDQAQRLQERISKGSSDAKEALREFKAAVGCRPDRFLTLYQAFQANETAMAQAKERFVVSNLKLVLSIAHRYHSHGLQLSDLIQEGNLGLMRAVDKFDYRKGYKFSTYASWWIRQAVTRAIADKGRLIRLPVYIHEITMRLSRAIGHFTRRYARRPTASELASMMRMPAPRIEKLMQETADVVSLEAPVLNNEEISRMDFMTNSYAHNPATLVETQLMQERVNAALKYLNPREETILRMRFGLTADHKEHTLDEVGKTLGLTRERIRQIEEKALQKLRSPEFCTGLQNFIPSMANQ